MFRDAVWALSLRWLVADDSDRSVFVCFSCIRGDFVKLFLHLERGEVNEYTPWSGLLCGGYSDVPHVFYSSGPGLVLEFHTDSLLSNSSGFIGTFRFIDRSKIFLHTFKISKSNIGLQVKSNQSIKYSIVMYFLSMIRLRPENTQFRINIRLNILKEYKYADNNYLNIIKLFRFLIDFTWLRNMPRFIIITDWLIIDLLIWVKNKATWPLLTFNLVITNNNTLVSNKNTDKIKYDIK